MFAVSEQAQFHLRDCRTHAETVPVSCVLEDSADANEVREAPSLDG